jgi:hypothetical protein
MERILKTGHIIPQIITLLSPKRIGIVHLGREVIDACMFFIHSFCCTYYPNINRLETTFQRRSNE